MLFRCRWAPNLEQSRPNHTMIDTSACDFSAVFTNALCEQVWKEGRSTICEFEHDVESLELFELKTNEPYLAEKLPLEEHLGKAPSGVEECHQHNTGSLKSHILQLELVSK
ncbi:hypothetical protein TNCV_1857241 [Trichonephila clavipes]|nr:hypothetical protein TNCV_1857241 [Trichonephila clavipes]